MYIARLIFLLVIAAHLTPIPVSADIFNGDFELADPNIGLGYTPPIGWNSINYTNVISHLDMSMINGNTTNWDENILQYGLSPFKGNHFVVLSTGDVRPQQEVEHATLSQEIQVRHGDRISGVYFFGACDYIPFDDYGIIRLIADPNTMSDPNGIILANVKISDTSIGDYGSMTGWRYFEHVFPEQYAGKYELVIGVYDQGDLILNSYLAVDALMLCRVPDYGDINHDCNLDMLDFELLACDWLKDCLDPNDVCLPGTDMNSDNSVNIMDLDILADEWLFQSQSQ